MDPTSILRIAQHIGLNPMRSCRTYQPQAQISNHGRACTGIGGFLGVCELGEPWKREKVEMG
jgi:hypothetical protein